MLIRRKSASQRVSAAALLAAAVVWGAPAHAGFFDQLFGGGGSSAPSSPSYSSPEPTDGFDQLHVHQHRAHKRVAALPHEVMPVRQKTTDLMHDRTLRPGDAVMMRDGFHIYNGPKVATHSPRQFVPVDEASHISASARATLVAIDTTRNDPLLRDHKPDTLASGRSAAVSTPINKGFRITDARGASVRYVGP